ncbi:metal ABC transporter ATP-binding protein [Alkanindiges sp. WGS2144]|uniref:metal ABC transporter ATP-binding protein n=1 Tax=Alkanindiges sp. WGS2144 TaxID=3366808 RepID=UPI003751F630
MPAMTTNTFMPNDILIQLNNINMQFEQRVVLQNVNLIIHTREIISLIGPNGAGKSTLVKVLLGILLPQQGTVSRLPHLKIGYVPQRFNPSASLPLRVLDLLEISAYPADFVKQIVMETGIAHLLKRQVQQLSGGERQRVLLARALLKKPQLLVLDEPMQGLDIQSETELYAYVRALPERYGCAVLMVSHDLQWVMQGTQRVICLNRHICCSGTPADIQQHPAYQEIFGTGRTIYQHQHDHCVHGEVNHANCTPAPHIHPEPEL